MWIHFLFQMFKKSSLFSIPSKNIFFLNKIFENLTWNRPSCEIHKHKKQNVVSVSCWWLYNFSFNHTFLVSNYTQMKFCFFLHCLHLLILSSRVRCVNCLIDFWHIFMLWFPSVFQAIEKRSTIFFWHVSHY